MAVITVFDIEYRKFSGWDEPQFPSGFWRGGGLSLGDATGGDNTVQINFATGGSQFNSQYYSLEQLMVNVPGTGGVNVGIQISNLDLFPGITSYNYTVILDGNEGNTESLAGRELPGFRGLWLGQQFTPNSSAAISFSLDNTNAEIFLVAAQGYVWGARSTGVPGGPQRPPTGLYR